MTVVTSAGGLLDALATASDIEVDGSLSGMPVMRLPLAARNKTSMSLSSTEAYVMCKLFLTTF
jgi:hypothetical protein